ncbi:MAG: ribonuclease III [Thermodesulfobacteriota bacterium]|nr:ribonuclease III [Thermodesulfobacteriota bacterium]
MNVQKVVPLSPKLEVEELSKRLGYSFRQPELLLEAFRHASYVNEQPDSNLRDNERLEFLGDAVLDLAISHILMELFQDAEEGDLSKFRAMVVDEAGLYRVALGLGLANYLLLGKGEEQNCGREKPSILANATEALIGALYLDAGFEVTMEIISKLFAPFIETINTGEMYHDFKSLLQEYTQQVYHALPSYRLFNESGPSHDKTFEVALALNGKVLAHGKGKSKKEAEQMAAREAFCCLKED